MNKLFLKKWFRVSVIVLICIISVYALIYVDVVLRSRSAFLQGEKYWRWYENPNEKQEALFDEFKKEKEKLDKSLSKDAITQEEYEKKIEIIKFNRDQKLNESSIKYAYVWYQTVIELFSPPESKWVKMARNKMPQAKELWKKELKEKNIPFEDYMLE